MMRLLVIDFTPTGGGTATGELKSALFSGLVDLPIMQISATGGAFEYSFPNQYSKPIRPQSLEDLLARADAFAPTIILSRPTAEQETLWLLSIALSARYDVPLVTWVMDDWLSVIGDAQKRDAFETSLRNVFQATGVGLSICTEMSEAFRERFDVPFTAVANGIDPEGEFKRFSPRESDPDSPFVFRYAGSLAYNMGVDTLDRVARGIKRLRLSGLDVHLQIKTRRFWLKQQGERFRGIAGVNASRSGMKRYTYLTWLSEADCNLICYNFGEQSRRYVRFSLANKLPELLAVGAPVLGIGPADLPTISRIRDLGAGFHLSNPSQEAVDRCLRNIVENRHRLRTVASRGRAVAESHFSLAEMRQRFVGALEQACVNYTSRGHAGRDSARQSAEGFDLFDLPFDFDDVATLTETNPTQGAIEIPDDQGENLPHILDGMDDPVPPRPEQSAPVSEAMVYDLAAQSPEEAETLDASLASIPFELEIPEGRAKDWLAPKIDGSRVFSAEARQRASARRSKYVNFHGKAGSNSILYIRAEQATVGGLNGAGLERKPSGGFVVHRHAAKPGDHAQYIPNLTHRVSGLRVDVSDVLGITELLCDGSVLVSISKPGAFEVALPQPRTLDRIAIRCLNSLEAFVEVDSIGFSTDT